jgi:hypothetical protein
VSLWLQKWRLILRAVYFPALLCSITHYWWAFRSRTNGVQTSWSLSVPATLYHVSTRYISVTHCTLK